MNQLTQFYHRHAQFEPREPFAVYLHGPAGTGKSSLARHLAPSLEAVLETYLDPELLVKTVKQNLNKPLDDLTLEFEPRPNNNDLSVMSIIQSRQLTREQTKPGLVLVDLEEMPPLATSDPNQLETCRLLAQRLDGKRGAFHEGRRSRNSRGISGDPTILVLFTSNYALAEESLSALQQIDMFRNLRTVEMDAISSEDRRSFALAFLRQCLRHRMPDLPEHVPMELDMDLGSGDTRHLVQRLRCLAYYASTINCSSRDCLSIRQDGETIVLRWGSMSLSTRIGSCSILIPTMATTSLDERASAASHFVREMCSDAQMNELNAVLGLWLARTLEPAVILSNRRDLVSGLLSAVATLPGVHCIDNVEVATYKMMRCLYDEQNTANLRDDILRFGRGALVATELVCEDKDDQLCIREMVEDTPSMTAFSSSKSALYKQGLLFCVYVGSEISPELRSRASLIL